MKSPIWWPLSLKLLILFHEFIQFSGSRGLMFGPCTLFFLTMLVLKLSAIGLKDSCTLKRGNAKYHWHQKKQQLLCLMLSQSLDLQWARSGKKAACLCEDTNLREKNIFQLFVCFAGVQNII